MTDATAQPLATGPLGMKLMAFHRGEPETARFPEARVGYAFVVLWHEGRWLMVHEHQRGCWELPGGGIEPGETPREAAAREVWEETGHRVAPADLRFVGFALTALGPEQRLLYGAMYTAHVQTPVPFTPNAEISAVHWRAGEEPPPGGGLVQTVDEYLVTLAHA